MKALSNVIDLVIGIATAAGLSLLKVNQNFVIESISVVIVWVQDR